MMLHTKYQGSMPYSFRQEDVSIFSNISLCILCDPGAGPFLAQGHNLMLQTKYQGSRPHGLRQEDFSMCFPI